MATNPDPNNITHFKGPYATQDTRAPAPLGPIGSSAPMATLVQEAQVKPPKLTQLQASASVGLPYCPVTQEYGQNFDFTPGDQGAVPPPHAPNSWPIEDDAAGIPRSRDAYREGGMIGQDFLDNQG